jgi:hypothetical protein
LTEFARAGDRRKSLVCRGAIVLALGGVFGTWRSSGPVSLNGVGGPHNGWLVIIFGLIALAGVGSLSRGGWLGIVTVLGAACVMDYAAVANLVDDSAVLGGRSGWGVWLTMVASAVLGSVAVLAAVQLIRGSTRARSRTSP